MDINRLSTDHISVLYAGNSCRLLEGLLLWLKVVRNLRYKGNLLIRVFLVAKLLKKMVSL